MNSTYNDRALASNRPTAGKPLLNELFAATPLSIFIAALNATPGEQQPSKR